MRRAIRKAETEKPSFLLGFFLVSVILYFDKKHTHTRPSFIIVFLLFPYIYIIFILDNREKKKKKKKKKTRRRRLDGHRAQQREEGEEKTREEAERGKMLVILTNPIRRKDEQERHLWDIVVL